MRRHLVNRLLAFFGFLALVSGITAQAHDQIWVERSFETVGEFDTCFRDTGISLSPEIGPVALASEDYVIYTNGNKLAGTTPETGFGKKVGFKPDLIGKKVFQLDDVQAKGAEIFLFGGTGKASFNGTPVEFGDFPHAGGWSRAEIHAERLLKGRNELLFLSGFGLAQDRETNPPKFSFVSQDGGKTWKPADSGEFLVHLRLQRHPAQGIITSPLIDLANPFGENSICPLISVRRIRIDHDSSEPKGTTVEFEARSGQSSWPDSSWSAWRPVKALPLARYVQWRAILSTKNRSRTPLLSKVTVTALADTLAGAEKQGLSAQEFKNQKIVRSSYPYGFQRPSEKLKRLREQFKLDEVVAPGKSEFEQQLLLRNWARRQWECNDGFGGTWDALDILAAPPGKKGMCVHFATLFTQAALALGFNARQVVLHHHFVADVWSNEHQTWVLMDVEGVYSPGGFKHYGTAHYLDAATKRPLNCLEVHQAYHRALDATKDTMEDVVQAYYYDDGGVTYVPHEVRRSPKELSPFERFAYPPRNDYLDKLDPWEEYHGQDHYHSNDYLWWKSASPRGAEPQYSWRSGRAGDFYWTVNQAQITLTATPDPGRLTVSLDTVTPNLKAFLYRLNAGDWQTILGEGNDPDSRRATFLWELKRGSNLLEAKPVNVFGREGITSSITVCSEWGDKQ